MAEDPCGCALPDGEERDMKKVSVIIPVYNGENYLAKAIGSVLEQDYPNIEIIVCDGESTDRTAEIAKSYGVQVAQGKLYLNPNWNEAMKLGSGEYVKLLCHDDTLRKDCIGLQVEFLNNNPDVIMVSCQRQYIDKDGNKMHTPQPIPQSVHLTGKEAQLLMMKYGNIIGETSCVLSRKRDIEFPPTLNWLLDMYLWMKLLSEGNLFYIGEPLTNIRKHSEQDTYRVLADPKYGEKEASDKQQLFSIYQQALA